MSKLKSQNSNLKQEVKTEDIKTTKPSFATPSAKATDVKKASDGKSSKEPQTMADLLNETGYTLISWQRGKIIEGKVVSVSNRHLNVNIGGKNEAQVHEKEIPYIQDLLKELKIGDKITVTLVNPENDRGQTIVSLRKTALSKRWELLVEKMKKGEILEVIIKSVSKGGFLVDYMGLRGFIPLSQVDSELTRNGDRAIGRRVNVKVIEVDKDINRLVFSQLAGGITQKQQSALKNVKIGEIYPVEITGVVPFGGFVNVKVSQDTYLSGLIHISEIIWEKVDNTNNYLKIGQKMDAKLIGIDEKLGKLTLSLKQLLSDPWNDVIKVLSVDQTIKGTVTKMSPYGAFVSLLPGIEGLIHISKIAPGEEPKAGTEIECTIEEINPDKRKISLSMISLAKPIGYR